MGNYPFLENHKRAPLVLVPLACAICLFWISSPSLNILHFPPDTAQFIFTSNLTGPNFTNSDRAQHTFELKMKYSDLNGHNKSTFKERIRRQNNYCDHNKSKLNGQNIVIDEKHKLIYCPIPKVGTSSMLSFLIKENGHFSNKSADFWVTFLPHNPGKQARYGLRRLRPQDVTNKSGHYTRLIIVRHPFDRLLSAFDDKFSYHKIYMPYYSLYVLAKYRHKMTHVKLGYYSGLFRKAASFKHGKANTLQRLWGIYLLTRNNTFWKKDDVDIIQESLSNPVTFSEFLSFSLDHGDRHWGVMSPWCSTCQMHYTAIMKVETMTEDFQNLEDMVRFNGPLHTVRSLRPSKWKTDDGCVYTQSLTPFQNVTSNVINTLFKKYKSDFERFGYSWNSTTNTAVCGSIFPERYCC